MVLVMASREAGPCEWRPNSRAASTVVMSNLRSFSIEIFRFPCFVPKNNEHFHVFSANYNRNTSFRFANEFFFLDNQTFCLVRKFFSSTSFFVLPSKYFLLEPNVFSSQNFLNRTSSFPFAFEILPRQNVFSF
jgi:hypothetical protein